MGPQYWLCFPYGLLKRWLWIALFSLFYGRDSLEGPRDLLDGWKFPVALEGVDLEPGSREARLEQALPRRSLRALVASPVQKPPSKSLSLGVLVGCGGAPLCNSFPSMNDL